MSAMSAASSGPMKTLSGGGSGGVQSGGAGLMPLSLIAEHKVGPNPPPPSQPLARTPPEKLPVAVPSVPKPTANGMEPPQATAPLPLHQQPHPQQQHVPDLPPPVAAAPDPPPPVLPLANNSQPNLPCGGREADTVDGLRRFDEANNVGEGSVGGTNSVPTPSSAQQQQPVIGAVAPLVAPQPAPVPPSPPPPLQQVVPPQMPVASVPPQVPVLQQPMEAPQPLQPQVPLEEPATSSQPPVPVEGSSASTSVAPSTPSTVTSTAQTPQEPVKVVPPAKPAGASVPTEKAPPPAKTPKRAKPAESRREKIVPVTPSTPDDDGSDGRKSQRKRLPTQPYQSPYPVLNIIAKINKIDKTPNKANEEKLIVFYKSEFLAVRNDEGSFYVCQAMQNIYKSTAKIKIRWLSSTQDASGTDVYSPDFYDTTDFDCILTNLNLEKIEKDKFKLPDIELQRTQSILKRAIDVEKGVAENTTVTEEHPDGLDLSLYRNEEQLKKRKSKKAKRKEETSEGAEPTRRSTRPKKSGRRGKKKGRGKSDGGAAKAEKVESPVASPAPAPSTESRTVKRKAGAAVNRKLDAAIGSKKKKLGPSRKEIAPPKIPLANQAENKGVSSTRGNGGSPALKRKGPPVSGGTTTLSVAPPPPEKRSRRGTTTPAASEPSTSSKTKTLDAVVMRLKDRKRVQ